MPSLPESVAVQPGSACQTAAQLYQSSVEENASMLGSDSHSGPIVRGPSQEEQWQGFGPVRTRVRHKSAPEPFLRRPPQLQTDDLAELFQELTDQPEVPQTVAASSSSHADADLPPSPREPAFKRHASSTPDTLREMSRQDSASEVLFSDEVMSALREQSLHASEVEVLIAGFLQKQMQKELPVKGNAPELQQEVEESKSAQWCTMKNKLAVKIHSGAQAERIKKDFPDRFVGSRFVVTRKVDVEGTRIKSRWCLQGHLDPDVMQKVSSGACHSPTMSQLSRALLLQLIVSINGECV